MSRLEGTIALITGAARGQGRSHALRLARDGAAPPDASDAGAFRDQLEVNLIGVWNTVHAAAPTMIDQAIAWLVSDDARFVTGVALPVDAGFLTP